MRPESVTFAVYVVGLCLGGLEALCFSYLACYQETYLDPEYMEIHHQDLEERSVASCGALCFRERPRTRLVMAKMVELNERLVCGCGDEAALGNRSGVVDDLLHCRSCPDDRRKCGGRRTISVYEVDDNNRTCSDTAQLSATTATTTTTSAASLPTTTSPEGALPLQVVLLGCYRKEDLTNTGFIESLYFDWHGVETPKCFRSCRIEYPQLDVFFLQLMNNNTLSCGCGTEDVLGSAVAVPENRCRQGGTRDLPVGGHETFSVYRSNNSRILQGNLLLLVLCFIRPYVSAVAYF